MPTPDNDTDCTQVAAGIIITEDDRVLIARRPADSHQGGLWEFPGGKLRQGESPAAALRRELKEEIGITAERQFPFKRVHHHYPDKSISLHIRRVTQWSGTPESREGQTIKWMPLTRIFNGRDSERKKSKKNTECKDKTGNQDVTEAYAEGLHPADFPAANEPIIRALQLPRYLAITPQLPNLDELMNLLTHYHNSGLCLAQLRQHQLSEAEYASWFQQASAYCQKANINLLANQPLSALSRLQPDCCHLNSKALMSLKEHPRPSETGSKFGGRLLTASCHNKDELIQAKRLGVDLALLSPVQATKKGDGGSVLWWKGFEALAATVSMPVYALGGVVQDDWPQIYQHGGMGVAGIRAFLP